jgi:hypothetical protein
MIHKLCQGSLQKSIMSEEIENIPSKQEGFDKQAQR